jgi:hypothetical protein
MGIFICDRLGRLTGGTGGTKATGTPGTHPLRVSSRCDHPGGPAETGRDINYTIIVIQVYVNQKTDRLKACSQITKPTPRVSVRTFSISKRGGCETSPLFKLRNHCSTRAVQLLVQVFHLVFHLHLWCSTLQTTAQAAGGGVRSGTVGTASPRPCAAPACVILCDVLLAAHSV